MLKGIDSQMMVTRTAEMTRDASALQRQNDVARDFMAAQAQALARQETQQVAQTLKGQQVLAHKDKQEKGDRGRQEEEPGQKHGSAPAEDEYPPARVDKHNIIDIKI